MFTVEETEGKRGCFRYLRVLRGTGEVGGLCGVETGELSGGCAGIKPDVFLVRTMCLEPGVESVGHGRGPG